MHPSRLQFADYVDFPWFNGFCCSVTQSCLTHGVAIGHPSLSFFISRSLLKLFELVMPSNHLILSHPLLLLPPVFPSIRVFSNLPSFAQWGFVPYPVFFSCVSISLKMMELCKIT